MRSRAGWSGRNTHREEEEQEQEQEQKQEQETAADSVSQPQTCPDSHLHTVTEDNVVEGRIIKTFITSLHPLKTDKKCNNTNNNKFSLE